MKLSTYLDGNYLENDHWKLGTRSEKLLEIMSKYADRNDSILELGCSAGRNLKYLFDAKYLNLTGLEMSEKAFKRIGDYTKKIFGRFEDLIDGLGKYDIVISMSFLQEGHETNAIEKLPRIIGKYLITIDDPLHDFEEIFLKKGLRKVEEIAPSKHSPFSTPIKIYGNKNIQNIR